MAQIKAEQVMISAGSKTTGSNSTGVPVDGAKTLRVRVNVTALVGTLVLFFDDSGPTGDWRQFATSGDITSVGAYEYTFESKEFANNVRMRWTIGTSFNATARMTITEEI